VGPFGRDKHALLSMEGGCWVTYSTVWNREVRGETPGVPRNRMLCNALLRPRSDAHMCRRYISNVPVW
jgi:hypothetical protein